jgi:phosphoribosyl-ATP pyrophosphohydrolase
MKIYILARGSYSDYSVMAVVTSKEIAEKWENKGDEFSFEEFELDNLENVQECLDQKYWYKVTLTKNGDVLDLRDTYVALENRHEDWKKLSYTTAKTFVTLVFTDSKTSAIKIANERRAFILSDLNLWVEMFSNK